MWNFPEIKSSRKKGWFSIQSSYNVLDLFDLNSYTTKLHLMIISCPSGSLEMLPKDCRMWEYLLLFRILQHLQVQNCSLQPSSSPVLLGNIGHALSNMACNCCHCFLTLPLMCWLTSSPSSQTFVAFFFGNSGLLFTYIYINKYYLI